jgi:hypothetical protein
MKNLLFLLLIIGTAFTTACSTDGDTKMSDDSATEAAPAAEAASEPTAAPATTETSATAASSSASTSAGNDVTYTCTHDGSIRTIRILYHEAGSMVCEVTYEKASGTQTLWSAANDDTYCAPKAEAFVAKQEGWGWSCSK